MLSLSKRRQFHCSKSLKFGFAGLRANMQKAEMIKELRNVNKWVHFIPKAEMDQYTLDSYKLAFMADFADGGLWSVGYDGEEAHLYETRIRGREGYGFMSASVSQVWNVKYGKDMPFVARIKLPDPGNLLNDWVPAENKDGHAFNTYKPYRKPTDDPNPNLMRLRQGFQDRMQINQVWDLFRPYRLNNRRHTYSNHYMANPIKKYYFNANLNARGTSWDHLNYIDNQNNWKPLTQNEQTAHKERMEIKLRNKIYFDKLRFHPKTFKYFKHYETDAQFAKNFVVNSIPFFIYEADRTLSDRIKIGRIVAVIVLFLAYLFLDEFQSGTRRPKHLPVVEKYGPHYKTYKYSGVATNDIYGRDQDPDISLNLLWTYWIGCITLFWQAWHYDKQEDSEWKKLHTFTDADFREDFKYVMPHDWKQNFMKYSLGHNSDLNETYSIKYSEEDVE